MTPPDLYGYLDYRAFLRDWYEHKKSTNRRFSHRAFSRRAGLRSPSALRDVSAGRRNLTPASTEAFCRALGLDTEESAFFTWLVQLDQAANSEERNAAWDHIAATRRFREARRIEGEAVAYLSRWYYPAIRELAYRPGFRPDPTWIARQLRPAITAAQARDALSALEALGMLRIDGDTAHPTDGSLVTPHEVAGLAVHNYHKGMLQLAGEAIERFRPHERHFLGVTVGVPEERVAELKDELSRFQERLLDLCADDNGGRVVQLHLCMFPLSNDEDAQ